MKRIWILAALLVIATVPADAGEGCSASTQECLDYMANQMKNSGWIGVEMDGIDGRDGYEIVKVVPESPAEEAGIQAGDYLVAINGIEINEENGKELAAARADFTPGTSVTWSMVRGDADRKVAITLAPMPADMLARYIGDHMLEHATTEVASN